MHINYVKNMDMKIFFSEVKNYFYEMFMKEQKNESECA